MVVLVSGVATIAACSSGSSSATTTATATATVVASATSTPTTAPTEVATTPSTTPPIPGGPQTGTLARGVYFNPVFQIQFNYPVDWTPASDDPQRLEGSDGLAVVNAVDGSGQSLDQVASSAADHVLQPYGTSPVIEQTTVAGVDARLIRPSEDAPGQPFQMAAVIFAPPQPVNLEGAEYHFVEIDADVAHIDAIVSSIQFVSDVPTGVR